MSIHYLEASQAQPNSFNMSFHYFALIVSIFRQGINI